MKQRKETFEEPRHCEACDGERMHLVWVRARTVERKCMGCGKEDSRTRKGGPVIRAERAASRQRRETAVRFSRQEEEARRSLERAAARMDRRGRRRDGWGF